MNTETVLRNRLVGGRSMSAPLEAALRENMSINLVMAKGTIEDYLRFFMCWTGLDLMPYYTHHVHINHRCIQVYYTIKYDDGSELGRTGSFFISQLPDGREGYLPEAVFTADHQVALTHTSRFQEGSFSVLLPGALGSNRSLIHESKIRTEIEERAKVSLDKLMTYLRGRTTAHHVYAPQELDDILNTWNDCKDFDGKLTALTVTQTGSGATFSGNLDMTYFARSVLHETASYEYACTVPFSETVLYTEKSTDSEFIDEIMNCKAVDVFLAKWHAGDKGSLSDLSAIMLNHLCSAEVSEKHGHLSLYLEASVWDIDAATYHSLDVENSMRNCLATNVKVVYNHQGHQKVVYRSFFERKDKLELLLQEEKSKAQSSVLKSLLEHIQVAPEVKAYMKVAVAVGGDSRASVNTDIVNMLNAMAVKLGADIQFKIRSMSLWYPYGSKLVETDKGEVALDETVCLNIQLEITQPDGTHVELVQVFKTRLDFRIGTDKKEVVTFKLGAHQVNPDAAEQNEQLSALIRRPENMKVLLALYMCSGSNKELRNAAITEWLASMIKKEIPAIKAVLARPEGDEYNLNALHVDYYGAFETDPTQVAIYLKDLGDIKLFLAGRSLIEVGELARWNGESASQTELVLPMTDEEIQGAVRVALKEASRARESLGKGARKGFSVTRLAGIALREVNWESDRFPKIYLEDATLDDGMFKIGFFYDDLINDTTIYFDVSVRLMAAKKKAPKKPAKK